MRHMIKTVCCLMLVAAVQGTALADKMIPPGPPPTADADVSQALTVCQEDLKLAVTAGAKCEGMTEAEFLDKIHGKSDANTTVVVTPAKPKGK